jgi:CubicO group peptidase (beta-lactamase class C family)
MSRSFSALTFVLILGLALACFHSTRVRTACWEDVVRDRQPLADRMPELVRAVESRRRTLKIPGLAVVVVQGDRALLMQGFGLRDVAKSQPVTPATVFGIGSCTKAFTALTALMAVEAGVLSLDDHPRKFLPYFRVADAAADEQMTIRDLLTHRTGLRAYDDEVWHNNDRLSREEVIRATMLRAPEAPFRSKFLYNNVMYTVAGECVAKAFGRSWEDVVTEKVFEPLGMKDSNLSIETFREPGDVAVGYQGAGDDPQPEPLHDLQNVAPAGAVNASARDLVRWLLFLVGDGKIDDRRLVSPRTLRECFAPQIAIEGTASYALGWEVGTTDRGCPFVVHGGGAVGHASRVWISPHQRAAWAVLANINSTRPFAEIANLVDAQLLPATNLNQLRTSMNLLAAALWITASFVIVGSRLRRRSLGWHCRLALGGTTALAFATVAFTLFAQSAFVLQATPWNAALLLGGAVGLATSLACQSRQGAGSRGLPTLGADDEPRLPTR